MIDGGIYRPERTVDVFEFEEIAVMMWSAQQVHELNQLISKLAAQDGFTVMREDMPNHSGPRLIIIRERRIPNICSIGHEYQFSAGSKDRTIHYRYQPY